MSFLNTFFTGFLAIILLSSDLMGLPYRSLSTINHFQSDTEITTGLIKIDTPLDIRVQGKIEKDFPLSWRSLYEKNNPIKSQLALQAYAQLNQWGSL